MGTLMHSRGVPQIACLAELPSSRPEAVAAAHREYLEAGAELIETLSFGANRHRLAIFGLEKQAGRLNRLAARLAREAREVSGRSALVGGSVGPLGPPTRELAHLAEPVTRSVFREQIEGLLEGGVDVVILETFSILGQLYLALDEARQASDLPIVASLTFGEDLVLADGTEPEAASLALLAAGADAIGVNCGAGPVASIDALERMASARREGSAGLYLSIMPNAGLPRRLEGRFVYAASAEYFAAATTRMVEAGARIVGGCCGTTPGHVGAMRVALDALSPAGAVDALEAPAAADVTAGRRRTAERASLGPAAAGTGFGPRTASYLRAGEGQPADAAPAPSRLARALAAGHFVVSVEIDPPRSIRIEPTVEAARLLRDAGSDIVNVSDSAMARVRMGAFAVAFAIQHDLDLECLVHCTTRDRNLMALESELLGAHALGVRNVLALTGDPPRVGDYPTGTGVWDVDSIGLIEILSRLNRGEDQAGSPIGQAAAFTIACALNPTAEDATAEWDRLERKLAAGAQLIMTQPLYTTGQVEAMLEGARQRFGPRSFPVPVLLGVMPLVSARHAEFLHHEVPGITVPEEVRRAMSRAADRGSELGIELADELLAAVEGQIAGTYVMPSFGRYEQCAGLVRRIRQRHPVASLGPLAVSGTG
jgi:homocysteine S-methyltransferase